MLTHSLKSYASSRGLSPIKALTELWRIRNCHAPETDAEFIGISVDFEHWRRTGELPRYATIALEYERLRQIEQHARADPGQFSMFP